MKSFWQDSRYPEWVKSNGSVPMYVPVEQLEAEIERLKKENEKLRNKLAQKTDEEA